MKNPSVFQFDTYMQLDAIKALKGDAKQAGVYQLLELFSQAEPSAPQIVHGYGSVMGQSAVQSAGGA